MCLTFPLLSLFWEIAYISTTCSRHRVNENFLFLNFIVHVDLIQDNRVIQFNSIQFNSWGIECMLNNLFSWRLWEILVGGVVKQVGITTVNHISWWSLHLIIGAKNYTNVL